MSDIESAPVKEKSSRKKPEIKRPWRVILYNDDIHSFDEVILQLQKATGCSDRDATRTAFEAHSNGKAVAFEGPFTQCHRVAGTLREIGLIIEIQG